MEQESAKPNEVSQVSCLPTRPFSHHELVAGMIRRDPQVSAAFFDVFGDHINRLVWKLLRSEEDHDDVVNTALISIMQSIKKLKDPQCLPKWVSIVTVHTVRNEIRKRQLRRRFFRDVDAPETFLAPSQPRTEDISGRVMTIVRTMRPDYRIVFTLHYIEGHSFGEICEMQDCSLSTTKRTARRAKLAFLKKAARDVVLAGYIEAMEDNERI